MKDLGRDRDPRQLPGGFVLDFAHASQSGGEVVDRRDRLLEDTPGGRRCAWRFEVISKSNSEPRRRRFATDLQMPAVAAVVVGVVAPREKDP